MNMSHSSIQRILVPLDVSEYAEASTYRACVLARSNQAAVTGMVVLDTPEIAGRSLPAQPAMLLDYTMESVAAQTEDARRRIKDELEKFAYRCEEAHVTHNEAEFQGIPSEHIIQASKYYDLLVMGLRTYFHFETQTGPGNSLTQILGHTPTPVLTVPKTSWQPLSSILIAFDTSFNAVRAMHTFAKINWPEEVDVTLIMSHPDKAYRDLSLEQAAAYLRSHALNNIRSVGTDREIRQVIDEDYIEKTDLVVAGMHAQNRFKDFFVGSLTKQLIDYGHTALLLA